QGGHLAGRRVRVATDPAFVEPSQRGSVDVVETVTAAALDDDDARVRQDVQVLHDGEAGELRQKVRYVAGGEGAGAERIEDPAAPGASERLPEGVGVAVGVGPRGTRPPAASRAVGVACGHVSGGHVMFISHVVPPGGGTAGYVLSDAIQTRPATQPPGSLTAVWVAVVACYLGRRVPSVRRQASPVTDGHGLSAITIATAVAGGRNWAVID